LQLGKGLADGKGTLSIDPSPDVLTVLMQDRIAIDSEIHFGKPCVAGTRIPVQSVLELIREGVGFDQITRDYYPDLEADDLRACVQYAMDVLAAEDIHFASTR